MILIRLYVQFFMTGLFSIGGGLATLPFLYDMGERTGWFTAADIADMIAVSEATPGAIGINMASYCGFTVAGFTGAVIATLGLISPGIIIIIIIAEFLKNFRHNRYVEWALYGLRAASIGLIAAAGVSVCEAALIHPAGTAVPGITLPGGSLIDIRAVILAAVIFISMNIFKKVHPVFFIAFAAAAGVIFSFAGV